MRLNWRRVYVGLFTLQVVLAVYLVFTYLGGKSHITMTTPPPTQSQIAADANEVGKVGAMGIGTVQKARFVNFNEDNQVSRELGFEKLLHKTGDQWEITEPFLNLYQQDFECRITALDGVVIADDLAGTADIKEATLKDNVVVHIVPRGRTNIGQIDIYLDDIVFISDRSLFLTAGPVKILAKDMQLLGRGLEIVYNYAEDRLELFRIIDLESLCLNRVRGSSLSQPRDDPAVFSENRKEQDNSPFDRYQAVLTANVGVRSAGKILFADEKLTIQNIIRKKDIVKDTSKAGTSEPNAVFQESARNLFDIVVTCDEGLVVRPMNSTTGQPGLLSTIPVGSSKQQQKTTQVDETADINSLRAKTVNYDAANRQALATGPVKVIYHTKDRAKDGNEVTVTISAEDTLTFLPDSRRVVFQGNCVCIYSHNDRAKPRKYTLTAPKITATLAAEPSGSDEPAYLQHILAEGGVTAAMHDTLTGRQIAQFDTPRLDYVAEGGNIIATGPSELLLWRTTTGEPDVAKPAKPVKITASKKVYFEPALNTIIFEGDCFCETIQSHPVQDKKYTLASGYISVELLGGDNKTSALQIAGLKKVITRDNAVIVVTPINSVTELARFTASRIKYTAISESIVADGPCVFTFYANDFMPNQALGTAVPVQINAKRNTTFLPAQNKLTFEGDCICTMVRSKLDSQNNYTLSAPRITLDLSRQQRPDSAASALGIDRFTADGGIVQVSSVKTVSDRLAGFNKIKCTRFIYDTAGKLFTAVGPGVITVDNSNIEEHQASTSGLSITKRCYAFLRDFTTLDFDLEANHIIARNSQTKMFADYFPVVDGQKQQQIKASAGAIEIQLTSGDSDKNEISTLKASEGITYEDSDNQFIASQMFYDAKTSLVKAYGSDFHRCYLNGAIVDNIVYDLNRRAVLNIDITDPGRVQALK